MKKFLLFILLMFPLLVKADTYSFSDGQFYDNENGYLTSISTNCSNGSCGAEIPSMIANSSGGAFGFSSPIPILANHTYTVTIDFRTSQSDCVVLSTYNRIGVGTSMSSAVSSYQNQTSVSMLYSKSLGKGVIQFVFSSDINGSYLVIPFSTTITQHYASYMVDNVIIDDLGISGGLTQGDINNSLNNQTNTLNQSIQNVEDNINDSIKDTENNINDKLQETQDSINDTINDNFNSCRPSNNKLKLVEGTRSLYGLTLTVKGDTVTINGTATRDNTYFQNFFTLDVADIPQGYVLTAFYVSGTATRNSSGPSPSIQIYSSGFRQSLLLSRLDLLNSSNSSISSSNNTSFTFYGNQFRADLNDTFDNFTFKLMLSPSLPTSYEPYGEEICSNKLDDTNDKLDNLQGAITDSSSPNLTGLDGSAGWLPAGPVDSILNLPLTFLNSISTNLSGSCTPVHLTFPFVNRPFDLPCVNTLYEKMGATTILNWLGGVVSALMLYSYLLKLYKWVDDTLTFRENNHIDNWGGI